MTEPEDKTRAYLAYTRRTGWIVVEWGPWATRMSNPNSVWYMRGVGSSVRREITKILAWADLPPPPPEAG